MTGISSATPPIDQALLPASLRGASKERKAEYQSALSFERVLVGQMTESMMKTASTSDEDAPAAIKIMKDSLPGTIADALMSAGGIGLAAQLDAAWHPESATKKTSLGATGDAPITPAPAAGQGGVPA